MKSFRMIAIAVALGVPALALAQPAGRTGATGAARVDVGRMAAPVRSDIVRVRPVVRVRGDVSVRRRAYEPNRRRFHDPDRRRFNHHARRRWNAAHPPGR